MAKQNDAQTLFKSARKHDPMKNKRAILEYYRAHPGSAQMKCAVALNLSLATVSKHVKDMRENGIPEEANQTETTG